MEKNTTVEALCDIAEYYTGKLSEYGEQPRGVDWNGEASQLLRFEQLVRVVDKAEDFSINDLGCGYGALYDHLRVHYGNFRYSGCDVSEAMIDAASRRHRDCRNVLFWVAAAPPERADYGVASGIFNVRLDRSDAEWHACLLRTLDSLDRTSQLGFAFNCLTSYSDSGKMKQYLYYADPCALFDHCKKHYSKNVALLHDYGLYEFTIVVRKSL
jgi:SAM-dependent methyltransferase